MALLGLALVPVSYWLLWRIRFGPRLRSRGENPHAAESVGVSVYRYEYAAVVISGALAWLVGVALVLNPGQLGYLEGQNGGRGYIGLAAMIFGNWRPGGPLAGSALFGYVNGLRPRAGGQAGHDPRYGASPLGITVGIGLAPRRRWLPSILAAAAAVAAYVVYFVTDTLPREFASNVPQLATLVVLAVAAQRLRRPFADGLEYRRGSK